MSDQDPQAPVVYLQFFARREQDGSFTLCLDSTSLDVLPEEIGKGFADVPAIITALTTALTAPAVAEDRMAAVEEYLPALNETIDAVNASNEALTALNDRFRELEAWREELERQGGGFNVPTRPAVPRVGQQRQQPTNTGLRRQSATGYEEIDITNPDVRRPAARPAGRSIVGPSSLDEPRPEFDRGTFKPHQPVPRVGRGPGSVG